MDTEESKASVPSAEGKDKTLSDSLLRLEEENKQVYGTLSKLQEESMMLREMFNTANSELTNLRKPALLVADVVQVMGDKAVIKLPNGNKFYCYISKEVKELKADDVVLADQKTLNVVEKINLSNNWDVEQFVIMEKPSESWQEVGGLKNEIQEVKEVIELPLLKPQLFEKVGIQPPKGVLLYGPPGTGKTLLAKAVANSTKATFIEVVGSELVQKFIGEGAKLVKDIFELARKKAPSIIFIDELDALAATRMDTGTSGEREVNRTFMQLLAELDGFSFLGNVKIIAATNRPDIIDPALLRQGRFDRVILTSVPDAESRKKILEIYLKRMPLAKNVDVAALAKDMEGYVGADIEGVCREAAMIALREDAKAKEVNMGHFRKALEVVRPSVDEEVTAAYAQLEHYFISARAKQITEMKKHDYVG